MTLFKSCACLGLLATLSLAPLAVAQEKVESKPGNSLVDASANNGSFESGELAPWSTAIFQVSTMSKSEPNPANVIKVVSEEGLATQGKSCASLQAAGDPKGQMAVARLDLVLPKTIDLETGRTFVVTWDYRYGEKPFTTPVLEFLAITDKGAVLAKAETLIDEPAAPGKWGKRSVKLTFPDTLKEYKLIQLRLGFAVRPSESGVNYQGYIDNITLVQSK